MKIVESEKVESCWIAGTEEQALIFMIRHPIKTKGKKYEYFIFFILNKYTKNTGKFHQIELIITFYKHEPFNKIN